MQGMDDFKSFSLSSNSWDYTNASHGMKFHLVRFFLVEENSIVFHSLGHRKFYLRTVPYVFNHGERIFTSTYATVMPVDLPTNFKVSLLEQIFDRKVLSSALQSTMFT
jgi:hypothetical protein